MNVSHKFLLAAGLILSSACLTAQADEPTKPIPLPQIPDKTFTITDYGAVGDGKTLNTAAIQKAIDAAKAAGGGKVVVPAGKFLTGPFTLANNLNLNVQKDATILFSDKQADWTANGRPSQRFLSADNCHDIEISGAGTIDGQGQATWAAFRQARTGVVRPNMVSIADCTRLYVHGLTLSNSPRYHLVPSNCTDVTIDGITIKAPANAPNTDGMDISGANYLITGCTIDNGDDNIVIKPGGGTNPKLVVCENMLITNCHFFHGHGLSIGGTTTSGARNIAMRDCTFEDTDSAIRMKAPRGGGGLVENISYDNLTMKNVKYAISIDSYYPESGMTENDPAQAITPLTPIWRHIRINNIKAEGGQYAGRIIGLPELHATDFILTNVQISAKEPLTIMHADNIKFVNSQITVTTGPAIKLLDAKIEGLDPVTGK